MAADDRADTAADAPGIYLHVPFCRRVCPYCDFAVQTGGADQRLAFVDALIREIDWWAGAGAAETSRLAARLREGAFSSVYLGGGTPSALSPAALERLLEALRRRLPIAVGTELTLEANPEDVDGDALGAWRDLGFTRLSLGVQSFDDAALARLGRAHRADRAVAAVEAALAAGFDAVSVDLIFAVPGQSAASWEATLQHAAALRPHHVSCYELTIHEGTPFQRARRRGRLVEVGADGKADLFFTAHRRLADAGYEGYEVSNFARHRRHRSRHNAKYWRHLPYLGLGPSAHSFDGVGRRWWNLRTMNDWAASLAAGSGPVSGEEELRGADLALEALALGLRTRAGIDLAAIEARHGVELVEANASRIDGWVADGLLREPAGARLRPTLRGMALADRLATSIEIGGGVAPAAEGAPAPSDVPA